MEDYREKESKILVSKGIKLAELGEYESAINIYNAAIKLVKNNIEAYFKRAYSYKALEAYEKAIEDYSKVIELDLLRVEAYYSRAWCLSKIKSFEMAIADYCVAIQLNPELRTAYNNRGFIYYQLKENEKAIIDFKKAINLDQYFELAYYNRARAYIQLNEFGAAVSDLSESIKLNSNEASSFSKRGFCYCKLQEYQKALQDYQKALEIKSDSLSTLLNLTEIQIIIGDYQKALDNITKSRRLSNEIKTEVLCLYFECIVRKMLNLSVTKCEKEFNNLTRRNINLSWNFSDIKIWLKRNIFTPDQKKFIIQKSKKLSKEFSNIHKIFQLFSNENPPNSINHDNIKCPSCGSQGSINRKIIADGKTPWVEITTVNSKKRVLVCSLCHIGVFLTLKSINSITSENSITSDKMFQQYLYDFDFDKLINKVYTKANIEKILSIQQSEISKMVDNIDMDNIRVDLHAKLNNINDILVYIRNHPYINDYDMLPRNLEKFVAKVKSKIASRSYTNLLVQMSRELDEVYNCPICGELTSHPDWCTVCGNDI